MSDIEFINIYSRRNHFCNFPKQTLQHPLASCQALLFISQQLRHFCQTKHWSPHTFDHIVYKLYFLYIISPQCLIRMGVLGCRGITLMALLTEPFLSPAWLNSNGLRFDFPTGTKKERANNSTHRHTPPGYLGKEEHAGRRWRKDWCQHINTIGITRCIGMHRTVTQTERQHGWSHG